MDGVEVVFVSIVMLTLKREINFASNGVVVYDELNDSFMGYFRDDYGSNAYVNGINIYVVFIMTTISIRSKRQKCQKIAIKIVLLKKLIKY